MSDSVVVVITNCPNAQVAHTLADALIHERLAACVNQLAPVVSTYRWEGRIAHETEVPLLIKTTAAQYAHVEEKIRSLHPYTVPEIMALPVVQGFAPYLQWVADAVASEPRV